MGDHRRPTHHGRRELLDVTAEPGDQPGPSRLASSGAGPWTFDMLCPRECGGLPIYSAVATWSGCWLVESAAQRGRQRVAAVSSFLEQARGVFLQQTGDPVAAQQLAWRALENLRQQQASALAYFDVFFMLAVVTVMLVPVVLLMKRSVAEKGAHIGHE